MSIETWMCQHHKTYSYSTKKTSIANWQNKGSLGHMDSILSCIW